MKKMIGAILCIFAMLHIVFFIILIPFCFTSLDTLLVLPILIMLESIFYLLFITGRRLRQDSFRKKHLSGLLLFVICVSCAYLFVGALVTGLIQHESADILLWLACVALIFVFLTYAGLCKFFDRKVFGGDHYTEKPCVHPQDWSEKRPVYDHATNITCRNCGSRNPAGLKKCAFCERRLKSR